jgi:hypothetical protein
MKNYDEIAKQVYEYENAKYRLETGSTLGSLAGKKQKKADAATTAKTGLPEAIETKIERDIKYRVDNRANTDLKYLRENINSRLTISLAFLDGDIQNYAIELCGINNEKIEDLELLANTMLDRSKEMLYENDNQVDKSNIQKNIHNLKEALSLIKHYSSTSSFSSGAKESRLLEDGFKESKETQLFEAILANNSSDVQKLISDTPDILKATDMHGDTPLMMAVKLKRYDLGNNIISTIAKKLNSNDKLKREVLAHKNKYGLNALNIAGNEERKVYKQLEKYHLSEDTFYEPKTEDSAAETTEQPSEIKTIKDNIDTAFAANKFQQLNGLIARSTLIGEVQEILNPKVGDEDYKPLIHKIISMPTILHDKKQKDDKLKTFKMLLDAGADPDKRSNDGKSLFQTIIEATSGGNKNLQDTAIKMLEELTRRGIKAPDDGDIFKAACASSDPKLFFKALSDNGFRAGDSEDIKNSLESAKIDKTTISKITAAVSSVEAPPLEDKISKTNEYRDNLVWDWLRDNREEKQWVRIGTPGSTTKLIESKKELKDMDRSRIKKDISFSLTQKGSWEDNLKALETLHNAVMVLCEIDPVFKKVYALHEKEHTKDYYIKDNIETLKNLVISKLDGKINIENNKSPVSEKEGQKETLTLAGLLTAQKDAVKGSIFPDNKQEGEIGPPPPAEIDGVAKKGYNAYINKYRSDNKHKQYHRINGPKAVIVDGEMLPLAKAKIAGPKVVLSAEGQKLKDSFTAALNSNSAKDLKTQIEEVYSSSSLSTDEKHGIFNTQRDPGGKTAYHLTYDYYFEDEKYSKDEYSQLKSKLSTDNESIETLTDDQGFSVANYIDISVISLFRDNNTKLEERLESIQKEDNYEEILKYKVEGDKSIQKIFEEAGLAVPEPIATAIPVEDNQTVERTQDPNSQRVVPSAVVTGQIHDESTHVDDVAPEVPTKDAKSPEEGILAKETVDGLDNEPSIGASKTTVLAPTKPSEKTSSREDIRSDLAKRFPGYIFNLNELSEKDIGKIQEAIKTPGTKNPELLALINQIRPETPIIKQPPPPPSRSVSPNASTNQDSTSSEKNPVNKVEVDETTTSAVTQDNQSPPPKPPPPPPVGAKNDAIATPHKDKLIEKLKTIDSTTDTCIEAGIREKAEDLSEEDAESLNRSIKVAGAITNSTIVMVNQRINILAASTTPSPAAILGAFGTLKPRQKGSESESVKHAPTKKLNLAEEAVNAHSSLRPAKDRHLAAKPETDTEKFRGEMKNVKLKSSPTNNESKSKSEGAKKSESPPSVASLLSGTVINKILSIRSAHTGDKDEQPDIDEVEHKLKQHEDTDGQYKNENLDKDTLESYRKIVDEAKEEAKDTIIDNWSDKDADNAKKDKTRCEGLLKKIETAIADIENKNEDTPTKSGPGSR